ncbi:hypothetical protein T439DRAFT_358440 [Meredithblackwellia eburnea MCA 4105]
MNDEHTKRNETEEKHEKEANAFYPYARLPLELRTRLAIFHRQMEGGARNPEVASTIDRSFQNAHTRQDGPHVVTDGRLLPEELHQLVIKGITVLENSELPNSSVLIQPVSAQALKEWSILDKNTLQRVGEVEIAHSGSALLSPGDLNIQLLRKVPNLIIRSTFFKWLDRAKPMTFSLTNLLLVHMQPWTIMRLLVDCKFPNIIKLKVEQLAEDSRHVPFEPAVPINVEELTLSRLSGFQLRQFVNSLVSRVQFYRDTSTPCRLHTLVMTNNFKLIPGDDVGEGNYLWVAELLGVEWLRKVLRTLVFEYAGSLIDLYRRGKALEPERSHMKLSKLAFFWQEGRSYAGAVSNILLRIADQITEAEKLHSIRLSLFTDRASDKETTSGRIFSLSLIEELKAPFRALLEALRGRHWKHLVVPSCWLGRMGSVWLEEAHRHTVEALVVEVLHWNTTSVSDIQLAQIHTWLPNLRTFILRAQTPPPTFEESDVFTRMMRELEEHTIPHERHTEQGEDGRWVYRVVAPPTWQIVKQFFDIPTRDGSSNVPDELAVHPFFVRHTWFSEEE